MSTGFVATRMIPSGLASAICGTSSRKIAAFFCTSSRRVSPGFWAAPAATTVTAAPRQSEIGPAQTRAVRAKGTACMRSIASPSAFRSLASDRTISAARPDRRSPKAKVEPTAPVPTTATRVGWAGASGSKVGRSHGPTLPDAIAWGEAGRRRPPALVAEAAGRAGSPVPGWAGPARLRGEDLQLGAQQLADRASREPVQEGDR